MRRHLAVIAVVVVGLVACGGNQDPTLEESSATSGPSSSVIAGDTVPGSETTAPPASDTTTPAGETVEPPPTEAPVVEVPAPPPGTPTYGPPAAGAYTYRVTSGQGSGQESVTTIEALNDTDIRQTSPGFLPGSGQQVLELRFTGNEARLLRMVVDTPVGRKEFRGDELFAPLPPAGRWSWTLRSTDNTTTVRLVANADEVPGAVAADITGRLGTFELTAHLVLAYDLNTRMPTRIEIRSNGQTVVSELVGFTPA